MRFDDKAELNGYLTIYKLYPDGSKEYVIEDDPNVITYASRRVHLQYLFDYDNAAKDELSSFKIGNGGAVGDDSQGNNNVKVITPDPKANDIYSHIVIPNTSITMTPSDPVSLPNEVYLQILFTISQDEANGYKINECGLFKDSGNMFNHKTFISIEKSEAFSLVFDWKLRYV
ncbi:hypothetical protein VPHD148_0016 [Vibrio phage D148]